MPDDFSTHYERIDAESDRRAEADEKMIAKYLEPKGCAPEPAVQSANSAELPELDVSEDDRMMAEDCVGTSAEREELFDAVAELHCRERQLLSALVQLQAANEKLAGVERERDAGQRIQYDLRARAEAAEAKLAASLGSKPEGFEEWYDSEPRPHGSDWEQMAKAAWTAALSSMRPACT